MPMLKSDEEAEEIENAHTKRLLKAVVIILIQKKLRKFKNIWKKNYVLQKKNFH